MCNNFLKAALALGPLELARRGVKWLLFFLLCRRSLPRYYALRSRIILELAKRGLYEPAELHFLTTRIPSGGVVLDIGANFGAYTVRLAELVGASGRVLAFEPLKGIFNSLVATTQCYPQVTCFQQGVSDRTLGTVTFTIPLLFGEIPEPALATLSDTQIQRCVNETAQVIALDTLDEQLERLDFIKIDVEGHELNCLQGARKLLMRYKPIVQFEENQPVLRMHLFQRFAEEVDYVVCKLTPQGYLIPLRNTHRLDEMRNFYIIPQERVQEFSPPISKTTRKPR